MVRVRHGEVAAVLNRLVREGLITSFKTNFVAKNEAGWTPEVTATLPAGADVAASLERVEGAVMPLGVTKVTLAHDASSRNEDEP
jgi:hypothetical protein